MNKKPPQSNALIIFQKNLILGSVKTRLAKSVGESEALEIYKKLVELTHKSTEGLEAQIFLFFSDFVSQAELKENWIGMIQSKGDLGEKMSNAFEKVFENGFEKVLIIGTDCPHISLELLNLAFENLSNSDIVLGPAEDGGYYLLGMKKLHSNLFQNMVWSTPSVLQETIERADSENLKVSLLPKLADVDTIEDWENYLNSLKNSY